MGVSCTNKKPSMELHPQKAQVLDRLNVYDVFALMGKHNSVPFSSGDTPKYYPDSVESAIAGYYMSRGAVACWAVLNALVIASVIIIERRKKD